MRRILMLLAIWGSIAPAQAAPPRPFSQNSNGLTQNNTSGLSQNVYGRSLTTTATDTAVSTGALADEIKVPVRPVPQRPTGKIAVPLRPATIQAQGLSPGAPDASAAGMEDPSSATPSATASPSIDSGLDSAMPEAPSDE